MGFRWRRAYSSAYLRDDSAVFGPAAMAFIRSEISLYSFPGAVLSISSYLADRSRMAVASLVY